MSTVYVNEIKQFYDNFRTLVSKQADAFISYVYMCYLRRLDVKGKVNMGIGSVTYTQPVKEDL